MGVPDWKELQDGGAVVFLGHAREGLSEDEAEALCEQWRAKGLDVWHGDRSLAVFGLKEEHPDRRWKAMWGRFLGRTSTDGRGAGAHLGWSHADLSRIVARVTATLAALDQPRPMLHLSYLNEFHQVHYLSARRAPPRSARPQAAPKPAPPARRLIDALLEAGMVELEPQASPAALEARLQGLQGAADLERRLMHDTDVAELFATTEDLDLLLSTW